MIFKILKTPGVGGMGHSPVEENVVGKGSPSEQRDHKTRAGLGRHSPTILMTRGTETERSQIPCLIGLQNKFKVGLGSLVEFYFTIKKK